MWLPHIYSFTYVSGIRNHRHTFNPHYTCLMQVLLVFHPQVVGRQIKKGPLRPEKRKSKKVRPAERQVKPLSLITLSLEEGPNNTLQAQREPAARESPGTISRHCSILDCRKYGVGNTTSMPIFPNAESEAEDEECRNVRALLSSACDGRHSKTLLPDVPQAECDKKQNQRHTRGSPAQKMMIKMQIR